MSPAKAAICVYNPLVINIYMGIKTLFDVFTDLMVLVFFLCDKYKWPLFTGGFIEKRALDALPTPSGKKAFFAVTFLELLIFIYLFNGCTKQITMK